MAMFPAYDSGDEEELKVERPDNRTHYRNHPARSTMEVLEELIAKFRDLEWTDVRYEGGWPEMLSNNPDDDGFIEMRYVCCLVYMLA
jgi:hypothetical protein